MKIDGEFLSNLLFADDIFICTETPQELQQMLRELSDESRRTGLKMNIAKTKVMVVDNTPINVNKVLIENIPGYVYLGQHYSLKEKNQDKEERRHEKTVPQITRMGREYVQELRCLRHTTTRRTRRV